jgi:hypothetical protein
MAKWLQAASAKMEAKGTKGSLTKIAKSHGESPMAFAKGHYHSKGKVGEKARFAVNANKGR